MNRTSLRLTPLSFSVPQPPQSTKHAALMTSLTQQHPTPNQMLRQTHFRFKKLQQVTKSKDVQRNSSKMTQFISKMHRKEENSSILLTLQSASTSRSGSNVSIQSMNQRVSKQAAKFPVPLLLCSKNLETEEIEMEDEEGWNESSIDARVQVRWREIGLTYEDA